MRVAPLLISVFSVAGSAFLFGTGMPLSGLLALAFGIHRSRQVFQDEVPPFEHW
jgi:hypothetical protein